MDGEALTKRYEVKDLETGEILDEPLYVLRVTQDNYASTAMFAYAALCGLAGRDMDNVDRLVASPNRYPVNAQKWRELLDEVVVPNMESPAFCDSFSGGARIGELSTLGAGADGTWAHAYKVLESLGLEPTTLICRSISEERQARARAWMSRRGQEETERGWKASGLI